MGDWTPSKGGSRDDWRSKPARLFCAAAAVLMWWLRVLLRLRRWPKKWEGGGVWESRSRMEWM